MRFSLKTLFVVLLLISSVSDCVGQAYPPLQGVPNGYLGYQPQPQYGYDAVGQLYDQNATLPLGGLFSPNFTRTLTLLGGFNFAGQSDYQFSDTDDFEVDIETGYAISFAFGRRHNRGLRSEIEFAIRENGLETGEASGDDRIRALSLMKNFIYDFKRGQRVRPYFGFGIGISNLDLQIDATPTTGAVDDGEIVFSYQPIGGVSTQISPALDFIVEYRYLGTANTRFEGIAVERDTNYGAHNIFFGLKHEY